jgi:MFS family permease
LTSLRTDGPESSALRRWTIASILMGAMLISVVDRFALSGLVEPLRADLHLTDAELGLLGGISFGLFYACMTLPLGYLADRWSRIGTIMLGIGVWCLATIACGYAYSFATLLVARIFVGAGEAALAPAGYSLIRNLFPPSQLARAMSVFQLGAILGSGAAFLVVGLVYAPLEAGAAAHWPVLAQLRPWQQTFVLVGAPGIVFVLLVSAIRDRPVPRVAGPKTGLAAAFALAPRFYFLLFTAMSGIITVTYALMSWVPAIMNREHARPVGSAASTYGVVVMICCTLGLLSGGWLADSLQRRDPQRAHCRIILISSAIMLPVILALPWASSWTVLLMVLCLFHFSSSLPIGVVPALIQLRTPPDARSRVSAAYVLTVNLFGLGVGPASVGFISQSLSRQADGLRLAVSALAAIAASVALIAAVALLRISGRTAQTAQLANERPS